jgi:tetratricopeptide (TPR) repeat protein
MLNKAFRVPEVDILFKLRLFIQNLHQLIISSSNNSSINTIYRSQLVTNDELEILKKCTDGSLIGFSHFFLASSECPEWKSKSSSSTTEDEEILFQIDVSNSNQYMFIENQILVTFGLVTRMGNIEKDKTGRTIIHLTTLNNDDRDFERIIEPIRKETRAPHPSLRLVKLFIELDQYSQAVYLGKVLLADLPNARKDPLLALARTFHSLGTTLYEKEDYDQALDVIKKSHELYLRFLPEDAPQLSPTWNNLGSIYLRQGKTDLALEYHEKALAIQLKSPSPDLPSIISYSNNIGGVYLKLERYDEALIHFKRALQIEEQTLPTNHPELAGTYHRIGGVYFRQNNYEKALEFYDKTLEIELASLPDNHPTVAVTYHNRGTAFEGLGKLEEAVESAEKAVERLLKTLPKEHPQVRMNQAYADRLKQKLWVKQLFTS